MKLRAFSVRVAKEILRDPLNLAFGLGFPTMLLLILSAIQANIPVPQFEIRQLGPGIAVFGLTFMTLFSAQLVAKDRESALLQRLYTTPLRASDFVLGYLLPLLPIAMVQCALTFAVSILLGLPATVTLVYAVLLVVPAALFFISLGLLFGSVMNVKQVGGVCGALLTNLCAWFSGAWFDVKLVGGVFERIANALPFIHATELERAVVQGAWSAVPSNLIWVLGYALVITPCAVCLFLRQMKRQ